MADERLVKRRRADREQLQRDIYAQAGVPFRGVHFESWDVDLLEGEQLTFSAGVTITRDPVQDQDQDPDLRWHVSIAGTKRVPTWNEVTRILHALRPGIVFVLAVPPRSWWINVHEHCLHAWEVDDDPLVQVWRTERRNDTPS